MCPRCLHVTSQTPVFLSEPPYKLAFLHSILEELENEISHRRRQLFRVPMFINHLNVLILTRMSKSSSGRDGELVTG
jgi:hypothetical protein